MSEIRTPWGSISSKVSLFPIYYLVFIYGFVYILPFGKNLIGTTWFDLLKKDSGIDAEYLTNLSLSLLSFSSRKYKIPLKRK